MEQLGIREELEDLGLSPEDHRILLLVPMAVVAWADGEADEKELETLADRFCPPAPGDADECALHVSDDAREFFAQRLMYRKPDEKLVARLLTLLAGRLAAVVPERSDRLRAFVARHCIETARSSGGALGLFGRISDAEEAAIRDLAAKLDLRQSPEAAELLIDANID